MFFMCLPNAVYISWVRPRFEVVRFVLYNVSYYLPLRTLFRISSATIPAYNDVRFVFVTSCFQRDRCLISYLFAYTRVFGGLIMLIFVVFSVLFCFVLFVILFVLFVYVLCPMLPVPLDCPFFISPSTERCNIMM